MSAGPSLYRRHRPRTFAEVVGQDHVVRTLSNAVTQNRVHHAYLFVGSRGTGKTSMAKILAACLNCERGPTVEPCGVCDSCMSIASATSLDVAEMDAASSNSVDDIRALRESVAYAPVSGRQKIYILDEAHMLSSAAWNAFLKTLEEPPPNTIFVLATTEAQRVPPTVVDRCHRFDFARPTAEQIATVLRRTATAEQIAIPDEALTVLARHAAGSFRDALGTLEQLQTYSGGAISLADVLAVLGIADSELLFALLDAIIDADSRSALLAVATAVDGGHEAARFIRELEAHTRELLVVQTLGGAVPAELRLTPERDERLAAQAQRAAAAILVRLLDLLAAALIAIRSAADARTQLELAVLRAARPDLDPAAAAFSARLARLEGATTAVAAVPQRAHAAPEPPQALHRHEAGTPNGKPPHVPAQPAGSSAHADDPLPPQPAGSSTHADDLALETVLDLWPAVLQSLRAANAMLGAFIAEAHPVELAGDRLTLAFAPDAAFQRRKVEDRASRDTVAQALLEVTGHRLLLDYELRERAASLAATPLSEEELVRRFKDEFDAEELADVHEESH